MIFVDRSTVPEPDTLAEAREAERAEVKAYYTKKHIAALRKAAAAAAKRRAKDPKSYDFAAYRAAKATLEGLFHEKCAYCEAKYKAVINGEVEHYRPKGRIVAGTGKRIWPGYYWLAASWTNLVPVCSMCNKTHTVTDLTDGRQRVTGKGERFPLADESKRARPGADPVHEEPLLIDPCTQQPADHLTFVERDEHRALLAGTSDRGARTVAILGLNRTPLVIRRVERLLQMEALMADIQRAQGQAARAQTNLDRQIALDEMTTKKAKLEAFQHADAEFAALARQVVPPFLAQMQAMANAALL